MTAALEHTCRKLPPDRDNRAIRKHVAEAIAAVSKNNQGPISWLRGRRSRSAFKGMEQCDVVALSSRYQCLAEEAARLAILLDCLQQARCETPACDRRGKPKPARACMLAQFAGPKIPNLDRRWLLKKKFHPERDRAGRQLGTQHRRSH
jgi:hypothetical protein